MKELKILLCCGAGMSSGFLAQRTRGVAKKRNISVNIEARSASDIASYMNSIDILMVGPHYENEKASFEEMARPYNVPVVIIPQTIYATLNGEALLDLAISTING
ncbi:MAG: PTS sugar transporter subunit IIB [Clostridium sp.]|uniref:PTS sugar transporter subunit IIB n=1 Tax=Clostridium sp. TaxID=1506 RepID=UPI0029135F76|nr:PTS sugar transporter subunit IIB [Clostridium sp.]MDU5109376.1 PTS sugar transporter subunit IIB [Clostridium sp.]